MSSEPIVARFDTREAAERARRRLLDSGIAAAINLSVLADDRSSTKGNFSVGNGIATADSPLSIWRRGLLSRELCQGGNCRPVHSARRLLRRCVEASRGADPGRVKRGSDR